VRFVLRDGRPALDETDPSLRLTPEQQAVFAFDRELCLSAGAGAGKTHTLALRYVALLVRAAWTVDQPDVVLVLTFTEKAAEEMADRCRARLAEAADAAAAAELGLSAADRGRWVANLRRMVTGFDAARIGTFHGFCATVLREFPGATDTPPGAAVLDPLLAREVVDDALDAELLAWRDARPADVLRLLDTFGSRRGILAAAAEVLARRSGLQGAVAEAAAGRPSLDDRIRGAPIPAARARQELADRWLPSLRLLVRLVAPSGGGPAVDAFRDALASVEGADPEASGPTELHDWSRLRAALAPWLTERGTLRSLRHPTVMGPKRAWGDDRRYTQAKAALEVLEGRVADAPALARAAAVLPTPADAVLHEVLPRFAGFVEGAAARLDALLRARRALTFDAMQDRAVEAVLRDPVVRGVLRERHRWLMVDEFQDTDARQWALVRALGRADAAVPEDRIFVVGDAKQAIYGFRGGDVAVFHEAARELGHTRRLSWNFRSRPGLVDWFNAVFPSVLGAAREPWEVAYEPLVAARTDGGGEVAWLASEAPEATTADAVADALDRGARSVAVLLRTRTRQDRYERALREASIPYTVPAGVGFWARPEVRDLVHALSAAAEGDPVATLGWLRSPLGGLPDAAIDDLGGAGIRALAAGRPPPGLGAVGERFLALRAELGTSLPSTWLDRRVDELLPALEVDEPGGRALANARRLVERLRPLDGRGAAAVARFARRATEDEEREGEAPSPGTSGVVLTTVHGAKGLEFDVVVVPELDGRAPPERGAVQLGRLGGRWHLAFAVDDPAAAVQSRVRPGLSEALRAQHRAEADAEDRRLLYVAATRARDRLVLVTRPPGEADPAATPTWTARLLPALPPATSRAAPPPATGRAPPPPPPLPPPFVPLPRLPVRELSPSAWAPAAEEVPGEAPVDERVRALAGLRGRVLHELLEDGDGDADTDAVARRWRAAARELPATDDELRRGEEQLRGALARLRELPGVRRALAARGHRELAFRVAHGPVALRGRIDRLWWDDEAGGWVVLDWKSGRPGSGHAARQLLAYGWAASRLFPEPVVRGEIVWAAAGVVETVGPWAPGAFAEVEAWLAAEAAPRA
jgi:ATP-dependent helicase/nuclease subunit A